MIKFEQVEQWPTLPFKFFQHHPGTPITVAPHWHPEVELNFLVAGGPLRFVAGNRATTYRPGDCWAVDRRVSHEADGDNTLTWDEFGFIIDERFLQGKLPQSADWQLHLNGQASATAAPAARSCPNSGPEGCSTTRRFASATTADSAPVSSCCPASPSATTS